MTKLNNLEFNLKVKYKIKISILLKFQNKEVPAKVPKKELDETV